MSDFWKKLTRDSRIPDRPGPELSQGDYVPPGQREGRDREPIELKPSRLLLDSMAPGGGAIMGLAQLLGGNQELPGDNTPVARGTTAAAMPKWIVQLLGHDPDQFPQLAPGPVRPGPREELPKLTLDSDPITEKAQQLLLEDLFRKKQAQRAAGSPLGMSERKLGMPNDGTFGAREADYMGGPRRAQKTISSVWDRLTKEHGADPDELAHDIASWRSQKYPFDYFAEPGHIQEWNEAKESGKLWGMEMPSDQKPLFTSTYTDPGVADKILGDNEHIVDRIRRYKHDYFPSEDGKWMLYRNKKGTISAVDSHYANGEQDMTMWDKHPSHVELPHGLPDFETLMKQITDDMADWGGDPEHIYDAAAQIYQDHGLPVPPKKK